MSFCKTFCCYSTWDMDLAFAFWVCNPAVVLCRFSLCEVLCTVVWALQSHGSNMGTARHQLWAFRQHQDRQGERGHHGFSLFFLHCKLLFSDYFYFLFFLHAKGGLHTALWSVFRKSGSWLSHVAVLQWWREGKDF